MVEMRVQPRVKAWERNRGCRRISTDAPVPVLSLVAAPLSDQDLACH